MTFDLRYAPAVALTALLLAIVLREYWLRRDRRRLGLGVGWTAVTAFLLVVAMTPGVGPPVSLMFWLVVIAVLVWRGYALARHLRRSE